MRWGAAEAARRGVPLRLVIGFDWPAELSKGYPRDGVAYRELMLEQSRGHLADAAVVGCRSTPTRPSSR